jgi:hypothetical protein
LNIEELGLEKLKREKNKGHGARVTENLHVLSREPSQKLKLFWSESESFPES